MPGFIRLRFKNYAVVLRAATPLFPLPYPVTRCRFFGSLVLTQRKNDDLLLVLDDVGVQLERMFQDAPPAVLNITQTIRFAIDLLENLSRME